MADADSSKLENLYDWLDTIPFSRPKKNLARDFSDGILAAELIKYFFPSMVEIHNYSSTNAVEQKKINWHTLNNKVLKKLECQLSDITISELANARREMTENFLGTLRNKIEAYNRKLTEKQIRKKKETPARIPKPMIENLLTNADPRTSFGAPLDSKYIEHKFEQLTVDGRKDLSRGDDNLWTPSDGNYDFVPRAVYEKKVHEALLKEETIQILHARVQRLEYIINMKDITIQRQNQQLDEFRSKPSMSESAAKMFTNIRFKHK